MVYASRVIVSLAFAITPAHGFFVQPPPRSTLASTTKINLSSEAKSNDSLPLPDLSKFDFNAIRDSVTDVISGIDIDGIAESSQAVRY